MAAATETQTTLPTALAGIFSGMETPVSTAPSYPTTGFAGEWCQCVNNLTCAYDPDFKVVGCYSPTPTATIQGGGWAYTGCLPFIPTRNFGMSHAYDEYITTCDPGLNYITTIPCATALLGYSSLTLTQYRCVSSQFGTTIGMPTITTLASGNTSLPAVRMITPSSTMTQAAVETTVPHSNVRVIVPAVLGSITGLLILVAVGVYLLKRRKPDRKKPTASKKTSRFGIIDRLGWMTTSTLIAGTILAIATLVFLFILWKSAATAKSGVIHSWVLGNSMPRIVSVCSYVLRLSTSAHSTAAITMIAAIALERFTARITEVPELLVSVVGQGSHHELVLVLLSGIVRTPTLRPVLLTSTVILAAMFFVLQLSSTILLSDLGMSYTNSDNTRGRVPVTYTTYRDYNLRMTRQSRYYEYPPLSFASFAEDSHANNSLQGEGFDFTGNVSRAFLPFASGSLRESLESYSGLTTVLDASMLCVAPPMRTFNFSTLEIPVDCPYEEGCSIHRTWVRGMFDWTSLKPSVSGHEFMKYFEPTWAGCLDCPFNILLEYGALEGLPASEWPIYMFWPDVPDDMDTNPSTRLFGFFNVSFHGPIDFGRDVYFPANETLSDFNVEIDGAWTTLKSKAQKFDFDFTLTMCISGRTTEQEAATELEDGISSIALVHWAESHIFSTGPRKEPIVTTNAVKDLDVSQILTQLNASPDIHSLGSRGILNLEETAAFLSHGGGSTIYEPVSLRLSLTDSLTDNDRYFLICTYCQGMSAFHPTYAAVLQTTLQTTDRPALAVQSLLTLIFQSLYYDQLPTFDISDDADMTNWVNVSVPVQWTGLIIVTVLTSLHTLLVLGILTVFITSTKHTKPKDPWSIFAHASSGELAKVIEEAKQLGATDHAEMMEQQGMDNEVVGLGPDKLDGEIGIRRRTQIAQASDTEESE